MADIIIKPGSTVTTRFRLTGNGIAATTITLWQQDPGHADDFIVFRTVKESEQPEDQSYLVGDAAELDGKVLEWLFSAEPTPGNDAQAVAEMHVLADGVPVPGFPLRKPFDYVNPPVTKSLSRRIKVQP